MRMFKNLDKDAGQPVFEYLSGNSDCNQFASGVYMVWMLEVYFNCNGGVEVQP